MVQRTISLGDGVASGSLRGSKISPQKLFADLLKRNARRVMQDVTECPPDTLPAHLARLDETMALYRFVINHQMAESSELRPSGMQLQHPSTLADFLACLEITRRTHRAPAFVNGYDAQLSELNHKIDLLAGLIARGGVPAPFQNNQGEEERL